MGLFVHAPRTSYVDRAGARPRALASRDIRDALIAHWPLDQANGPNDVVGGFNGTYSGTQTYVADQNGVANGATDFTGGSDFINIYDATLDAMLSREEGMVTAWAQAPTTFAGAIYTIQGTVAPTSLFVVFQSGINLVGQAQGGGNAGAINGSASTGAWFFCATFWSASLNKAQIKVEDFTGAEIGWNRDAAGGTANTNAFVIGAANTTPLLAWDGYVSDVKLYTRAPSPQELLQLEAAGI